MREKINDAVKAAMRAKDSVRLTTLRMVTSKIKDIEVLNVRPAGQEKASQDSGPILIRIDTSSGHGASSQTKALETTADIYSFIMFNMGLTPKPATVP